jgi:hypothetical protein
MTPPEWEDYLRKILESAASSPLHDAEQLARDYRAATPRPGSYRASTRVMDVDAAIIDVTGRLISVVETKTFHGTSLPYTLAVANAAQIIARAQPAEVVELAQDIAADPENSEAIDKASSTIRKAGIAGLSPGLLLIIVLVVITLGLSVGQTELPDKAQAVAANEVAYLALALAISDHLKRGK